MLVARKYLAFIHPEFHIIQSIVWYFINMIFWTKTRLL